MEQKLLDAKNYNFNNDFIVDSYIDAKDTLSKWCVAQIIEIDEANNSVRLHFEGWATRYDEVKLLMLFLQWIKKNSLRLAPFRRHTVCYTGQNNSTLRDFKFSYTQINEVYLNQIIYPQFSGKVNEIINSDFKIF